MPLVQMREFVIGLLFGIVSKKNKSIQFEGELLATSNSLHADIILLITT